MTDIMNNSNASSTNSSDLNSIDHINNLIAAQTLFAPYVSSYLSAVSSSASAASSSNSQWPATIDPRTMSMPLYPPEEIQTPVKMEDTEMATPSSAPSPVATAASLAQPVPSIVPISISSAKVNMKKAGNPNHPLSTTDKLRLALGQRGKTLPSAFQGPMPAADDSSAGGSASAAAAANLTLAEYSKLSSKEKRQLRNKVSARTFRVRRKEYIDHLEEQISLRDTEIDLIRTALEATNLENTTLRSEIQQLKEANTSSAASTSKQVLLVSEQNTKLFPAHVSSDEVENLSPEPSAYKPSTVTQNRPRLAAQQSQRSVLTPNTRKDLSAYGTSFGSTGFSGGYTVVHMLRPSNLSPPTSEQSFADILSRPFLPLSATKHHELQLHLSKESCKSLWELLLAVPAL